MEIAQQQQQVAITEEAKKKDLRTKTTTTSSSSTWNDEEKLPYTTGVLLIDPFQWKHLQTDRKKNSPKCSINEIDSMKLIVRDRQLKLSREDEKVMSEVVQRVHAILERMCFDGDVKMFTCIREVGSYATNTMLNVKPLTADLVALASRVLTYAEFEQIVAKFAQTIASEDDRDDEQAQTNNGNNMLRICEEETAIQDASFVVESRASSPNTTGDNVVNSGQHRVRILVGVDLLSLDRKAKNSINRSSRIARTILQQRFEAIRQINWWRDHVSGANMTPNGANDSNNNISAAVDTTTTTTTTASSLKQTELDNLITLIRVLKDVRRRFRDHLEPLNAWMLSHLALYCCCAKSNKNYSGTLTNSSVNSIGDAFRHTFMLLSGGCFLPDARYFVDPVKRGDHNLPRYLQSSLTPFEMDRLTRAAQYMFRLMKYEDNFDRIIGLVSGRIDLDSAHTYGDVRLEPGDECLC